MLLVGGRRQARAHAGLVRCRRGAEAFAHGIDVVLGDRQEAREVLRRLRPPSDRQEVEDLQEHARAPAAAGAHGGDELAQARDEAIVADAQQRPTRHVANAGCFDHQHAGRAVGEAAVPVEHVGGDEAVLGCSPRHHRRHPAPARRRHRSDRRRREQERLRGLFGGGPVCRWHFVAHDRLGGLAHGAPAVSRGPSVARGTRSGRGATDPSIAAVARGRA